MVQLNKTTFHHGELQAPRIAKDEKAVSAVQNLIDSWNNPFAENQNVVSISTAKEAPDDVRRDLLSRLVRRNTRNSRKNGSKALHKSQVP